MNNRKWVVFWMMGLLLLGGPVLAHAQAKHRWGLGTVGGLSLPVLGMGERFSGTGQYGITWQRGYSSRMTLEVEYHHAEFENGEETKRPFVWNFDKKEYLSPQAVSEMTFNNVLLNVLIAVGPQAPQKSRIYYFAFGPGIYGYKTERRNFIFPGQTGPVLNQTLYLPPQIDKKAALGVHAGFGGQIFLGDSFALDLRGRYHFVLGDIRPMAAWGFDGSTMPLQMFEIGAGLKFYFGKSQI